MEKKEANLRRLKRSSSQKKMNDGSDLLQKPKVMI